MSSRSEAAGPAAGGFVTGAWHGELATAWRPADLETSLARLTDPAHALETVHWGRNYLYRCRLETTAGPLEVVVKQFPCRGLKDRLRRALGGSKARRSWRFAHAFRAAGVPTPEPVMLIEPAAGEGASYFVSRHLGGVTEARYLLRAMNAGREAEAFPALDPVAFLRELGRLLRRMHGAGLFHRDLSIGNVLIESGPSTGAGAGPRLYVVDLNRAREHRRLGLIRRTRDLCRLAIFRREHQELFLGAYWGEDRLSASRRFVYRLFHHGFRFKIEAKKALRRRTRKLFEWLLPRGTHPHIPEAPPSASARDKIVWDALSDQPHQHAGRLEKLGVRRSDAGSHLRQATTFRAAAPRVRRAYRRLRSGLYREPVPWGGVGVCLRPWPQAPEALLAAVDALGVEHALLRLHPWQEDDHEEEALARELHARGLELAFALPQNRELVRDPRRWRRRVEELAERFTPYGRHFQVGQAVNRSKWGVWTSGEYLELARAAAAALRRHPGVEILGPAVIDFELHVTAALVNLPRSDLRFDALASLLYVDRRGAPESRQLGFDTVGKVLLLQAIAETARGCAPRSWITEVNWPLWEGPHSPAGKSVSVDEATQADYLARFYLLALTTGAVERVYWWQLVARGYGLVAPEADGVLRRRPSFAALSTLARELRGATSLGPLEAPQGCRLFLFRRPDGGETVAAWSESPGGRARLPRPAAAVRSQAGEELGAAPGTAVELATSVRYFHL